MPLQDFAVGFSFIVTSPVAPGDTEAIFGISDARIYLGKL